MTNTPPGADGFGLRCDGRQVLVRPVAPADAALCALSDRVSSIRSSSAPSPRAAKQPVATRWVLRDLGYGSARALIRVP